MSESRERGVQTVGLAGTYVPRQCGIATFTKDLRDALALVLGEKQTSVLAVDDVAEGYAYPPEVCWQVQEGRVKEYGICADLLNIRQLDVMILQHEFGIYGGRDGAHVVELTRRLRMPVVTTLHTVLKDPSAGQRAVMKELIRDSERLVVMSHRAAGMLQEVYKAPREKIAFIPHGIPDMPFVDPAFYRDQFGVEGRRVVLTFGLLGPSKGIDVAIRAMPRVIAKHPDVVYIVLGATHPSILRREGNTYLASLERLVKELKLQDHVEFHNRYVSLEELIRYIGLADIYLTPYPNKGQATSGTLAYALGAGKPVISTPYWYAEEMLAEGRGRLFDFGNSEALADQILDLLDNETERHAIRKRAYMQGRSMIWPEVARSYLALSEEILGERRRHVRVVEPPAERAELPPVPELSMEHLFRLTDDVGVVQHAIYSIADRHHGYCSDDNARALIAMLTYYDQTHDPAARRAVDVYLSFLTHAFNRETRRFRNFMSYDRRWLEEAGSEDSQGRSLWALGTAAYLAPHEGIFSLVMRLFHDAAGTVETFASPRSWAFTLVGLDRLLMRFRGDTQARRLRQNLAERLFGVFRQGTAEWPWFEDMVTYDNAKLPHALLLAGTGLKNEEMVAKGLESLEWLVNLQLSASGHVSLIGNGGWLRRDGARARFDQQPLEAMALVEACAEAYRITSEAVWAERARSFLDWFLGNNDTGIALYDVETGGCRDGLHPDGPNRNEGAESTLAWLISLETYQELKRSVAQGKAASGTNGHGVRAKGLLEREDGVVEVG